MKILIAVDGSEFTKKMLAYLTSHDEMFGTEHKFTIFTAQPPLPPRARTALGATAVEAYYAEQAEATLGPVLKLLGKLSLEAKSTWKVGPAGETISKFADSGKFELIVMGSHGHSSLGNLVMGSVATQVLAFSKVPVLLVR